MLKGRKLILLLIVVFVVWVVIGIFLYTGPKIAEPFDEEGEKFK